MALGGTFSGTLQAGGPIHTYAIFGVWPLPRRAFCAKGNHWPERGCGQNKRLPRSVCVLMERGPHIVVR